jgi:hypothetical protein
MRKIAHIKHTHAARPAMAWCGAALSSFDWCFQDIDHAAYECANPSLIEVDVCNPCVDAVVGALRVGNQPPGEEKRVDYPICPGSGHPPIDPTIMLHTVGGTALCGICNLAVSVYTTVSGAVLCNTHSAKRSAQIPVYLHRVLMADLGRWQEAGWRLLAHDDDSPSLKMQGQSVALIEWAGEGTPRLP